MAAILNHSMNLVLPLESSQNGILITNVVKVGNSTPCKWNSGKPIYIYIY